MTREEKYLEKTFFWEDLSVRENYHEIEKDCFQRPEEYLDISPYSLSLLDKVKAAFRKAGWDGGGDVKLQYVLPFTSNRLSDEDSANTIGTFIWYVKQKTNDKSFFGVYPNSMNSVAERSEKVSCD